MSTGLQLLAGIPPVLSPWRGQAHPPLGTAMVVPLSLVETLQEELAAAVNRWPWCPVVLVADRPTLGRELLNLVLLTLPRNPAIFPATTARAHPPELLRAAIRSRSPVTPDEVVDFLARRGLGRSLQGTVALALGEERDDLNEQLLESPARSVGDCRLGQLGPSDWRAVITLLHATERMMASLEAMAWEYGMDPRTFEDRARRYLGLGPADAARIPGWEWKLEAVLRRFGYVHDPGAEGSGANHTRPAAHGT